MWTSLIQIQKIIQKLLPLRIIFVDDKHGFSANFLAEKEFKMRLLDSNLGLIVIASIFGLKRVLSSNKNSTQTGLVLNGTPDEAKLKTQKMVLGSVLFLLFLTLFVYCLVATWTFKHRTKNIIFVMNQARGLYLDRLKNPGRILGVPTKKESALFGFLLYNLMMVCFFGLLAVTLFPLASNSNPAYEVLTWILPQKIFHEIPSVIKIICCVYLFFSGYFGVIPVIQAFSYLAAFLYELKYILKRGYNYNNTLGCKKSLKSFYREWIIYAENILFVREINQFGIFLYPAVMLTAFCVNVVTTMVCMKFYNELPVPMLLIFLGLDAVSAIATVVVHSFGVVAKEEGERFRMYWKTRLFSRLAKRQLNACIPIPIYVGPFFQLQRSTLLNTVNQIVNMVVTLLLADQ